MEKQCAPNRTDKLIEIHTEAIKKQEPIRDIINESRAIDSSITYNGDVFNAKTIAHIDLKKAIWADSSLSEDEKQFKFQSELAARYQHLKAVVFELDNKKHDAVVEQLAIGQTLRDLGNSIRAEISAKLKELDNQYQPTIKKPIKPSVKVEKKSPMDRLIEAYAQLHGCSITEAMLAIQKGK
jgi:hypothetical protein